MHFHRIGVSENVPAPELLNVSGPMFAWFRDNPSGDDTVGITGPTGYGFTLDGPWTHTTQGVGAKKWQTLTISAGSRFTLASPQGVELPLIANGKITIKTKPNLWGDMVGEVTTTAIKFPVSLGIDPINDLLADAFGSDVSVGVLTADWRISLGGKVFAKGGTDKTDSIEPLLSGVPYLRQQKPVTISAHIGEFDFDYEVTDNPIDIAFDPGDPMLYLRADEIQSLKKPALGLSRHGLLEFVGQRDPSTLSETRRRIAQRPRSISPKRPPISSLIFTGTSMCPARFHSRCGSFPSRRTASPFTTWTPTATVSSWPACSRAMICSTANFDNLPNARDVLHDIQAGHNGSLTVKPDGGQLHRLRAPRRRGDVGLQRSRGRFLVPRSAGTGGSLFDGTPLDFLDVRSTDVLEGCGTGQRRLRRPGHSQLRCRSSRPRVRLADQQ